MYIHTNFQTPDGETFRFRRKHPSESFAGMSGVFAITTIVNFEVVALQFLAVNDLWRADESALQFMPSYRLMARSVKLGVAIYMMAGSTYEEREISAMGLNDALRRIAMAA